PVACADFTRAGCAHDTKQKRRSSKSGVESGSLYYYRWDGDFGRVTKMKDIDNRLAREKNASIRRRNPQYESSIARAPPESLSFVNAVDENTPHNHHQCREHRHCNHKSERPKELADHEHRHDGENGWQLDFVRHHQRRNDISLEEMHNDAEENYEQRSGSSAGRAEHDHRRQN